MAKTQDKLTEANTSLRLEWMSPADLAENPANWRRHPEQQIDSLTDVLAEVGWAGACLFNERTGRLVDGHARRKVALAQGCDKVPVLIGSWDEATEKKILATLDPLAAMAEADSAQLAALLAEVQTESGPIQKMLDDLKAETATVEPLPTPGDGGDDFDATPDDGPTRTNVGEVWVIGGKHRLLVGDCTDPANVVLLMKGEKADLCFTSPPYGAGNTAKLRDHYVPGQADRESFYVSHEDKPSEWLSLMSAWYAAVRPAVNTVICNVQMLADNKRFMVQWLAGIADELVDVVVWDKGHGAPQMQANVLTNCFEFLFLFGGNGSRAIPFAKFHGNIGNIVRINPKGSNEFADTHRATMPVDLPIWAMGELCRDAATVIDPFLGSGTTLIAAHRLNRRCYGMEIEPKYADVILRRCEAEGLTCVLEQ